MRLSNRLWPSEISTTAKNSILIMTETENVCSSSQEGRQQNGENYQHQDDLPYSIIALTEDRKEETADFLSRTFFKDEPLNIAVSLKPDNESFLILLSECVSVIPEGLSLAAINSAGKIIGVCLNGPYIKTNINRDQTNNNEFIIDETSTDNDIKADRIHHVLDTLKEKSDVFGKFPHVDKILDIFIISVDNKYRGKGLCKALIDKTREVAKNNNFALIKVDCTSHFTAKAASRLGFKCIYTLPYDSIVDKEGHPVVKPDLPHVSAETYVSMV